MDSFLTLNFFYHGFRVTLARQNVHTERESRDSIDRNTLVNRKNISMEMRYGLKYYRQNSRLIIHLNDKGYRLSSRFFHGKEKYHPYIYKRSFD